MRKFLLKIHSKKAPGSAAKMLRDQVLFCPSIVDLQKAIKCFYGEKYFRLPSAYKLGLCTRNYLRQASFGHSNGKAVMFGIKEIDLPPKVEYERFYTNLYGFSYQFKFVSPSNWPSE